MDTEFYMKQTSGFIEPGEDHAVCKLKKYLYGAKQATSQWYLKIQRCMIVPTLAFLSKKEWEKQNYWKLF
jgi:hypothetical protein